MSLLGWLGVGKELAEPIKAVGELYTTDKQRLEAQAKLQEVIQPIELAQLENNKGLIASGKFFNIGWISLLGWTCGLLLLIFYAPQILITTYVWGKHCINTGKFFPFPMSADDILNLVYVLFGAGALTAFRNKK
jgi:hypothetical protein